VGTKGFKGTLLSALIITSLAVFLLVITAAKPVEASPGIVENFLPTEDTYVMEGYPDEVPHDGVGYGLYVGWDEQEYHSERIYAKFDLSAIPTGSVISARLWLYNKYSPSIGEPPFTPKDLTVEAYAVENDDWLENELTWNIAEAHHPPVGDALATVFISEMTTFNWNEWGGDDVTDYIVQEVAGDKIVTFCLKSTAEDVDDSVVWFYSKDAYQDQPRPYLEVYWRGVRVDILPCENKGSRGENITFTVTVTNETGSPDTFWLTVDSEWETDLPSSVGPIPDGDSEDVTLTVTIPDDASLGAEDEIKVTATSKANSSIYKFDTCFAGVPPIYPSHDAEVNSYYPDNNFGDNDRITVGTEIEDTTWVQMDWRSYLRFDLSDNIPSDATIDNAYLSLYTHFGGENGAQQGVPSWELYGDENVPISAYKVEDDLWTESAITWNNAPSLGATIFTDYIIPPTDDQRYQWDITDYVNAEWEGDKKVSIGLKSDEEGQNKFVPFISEETTHLRCEYETDWRPYLIVCYTPGENKHDVDVEISPDYQENENGGTLTYTVTITNTGDYTDTYDLVKSDTEGWPLSLPSSVGPLAPSTSVDVALEVTIPPDAEPCTEDNIIVTAICQDNTDVKDNDWCIAHVVALRSVEVNISPSYQSDLPGTMLTYIVEITNTGDIEDSYYSIVTDNFGWELEFGIKEITLLPLAPVWTALNVTIPENALGCTEDNITVTMISLDNNVSGNDSCTAHVEVVMGVEVSISPDYQSGLPGENLRDPIITVANLGNVNDNYELMATDNAGWALMLFDNLLEVPAGENGVTKLVVTIPENAAPGTEDNITVTVISQSDNTVTDSAGCIGHVGKADFEFENLYAVTLDFDYHFPEGENLVAKFYTYNWYSQDETVVCSENIPGHVTLLENISRPGGDAIERVVLAVVDEENNVITAIASFTVHQSHLRNRYVDILLAWPGYPELHDAFRAEIIDILLQWAGAPP
jgi:uncharacterized membrane protein